MTKPRSARSCAGGCSRTSAASACAGTWRRSMRTGASRGGRSFRRSGRQWTGGDGSQGAGVPPRPFRDLLSVPSGHAVRIPAQVAGPPQYQQTRGTLAMLAQWISLGLSDRLHGGRVGSPSSPSAPLRLMCPDFRSVVLGQLGESRLVAAIEADISGEPFPRPCPRCGHQRRPAEHPPPRRNDDPLRVLRRSGGQGGPSPELRFALGEPEVDTTTVDNAVFALEDKSLFHPARRPGRLQDRPPSHHEEGGERPAGLLDEESETRPTLRALVLKEFDRGRTISIVPFPLTGRPCRTHRG